MALLIFSFFSVNEVFCAEKAILVNQPAYHSMSFYVFKPDKVADEFLATYDGYLVYKKADGIWYYATVEKSGIKKTEYVVGSIIPSVVRLRPYNAKISSVAPVLADTVPIKPFGERISANERISMPLDSPEFFEI